MQKNSNLRRMLKPTKESFFERILRKSNKESSVIHAKISLIHFEKFCKKIYKKSSNQVIEELQVLVKKDPNHVIDFLDDLMAYLVNIRKINRKTNKREGDFIASITAKGYFSDIKLYLRHYRISIDNDAVRQFITFPKSRKEIEEPVTLDDIQKLVANANPIRKLFYLLLATTAIRLGELLQLKKHHFDLNQQPGKIYIPSKIAKNGHARITFTTREVKGDLKLFLMNLDDDDLVFIKSKSLERAKLTEETYFARLRVKCKISEMDPSGLKHRVRMHKLRKWFTTTTTRAGMPTEIRQTMEGWNGNFEETYHNYSTQELAEEYAKIENHLLIMPEWKAKHEIKEKDKQLRKIKEQESTLTDLQNHVDNVEQNLNKKMDELRITKVEKLWQKIELDIRKSHPRLASKIINQDWEDNVNNEKLKEILSIMSILLEDDGGLEGMLQDEDYKKLIKEIPQDLKNTRS